jgi:hypothetical protein
MLEHFNENNINYSAVHFTYGRAVQGRQFALELNLIFDLYLENSLYNSFIFLASGCYS